MNITEVLNRYAGSKDICRVYRDSNGQTTSARIPNVLWKVLQAYCAKRHVSLERLLVAVDMLPDNRLNFSATLRYLAIYIMEHPEDEIEFLINKQLP